jgi:hypothetical protein
VVSDDELTVKSKGSECSYAGNMKTASKKESAIRFF